MKVNLYINNKLFDTADVKKPLPRVITYSVYPALIGEGLKGNEPIKKEDYKLKFGYLLFARVSGSDYKLISAKL